MLQHKDKQRWRFPLSIFFIISFGMLYLNPASSLAAQNKVNFEAEALLPENQKSTASYYDLKVAPGQIQDLTIKLKNTSDEKVTVKVEANNAITNKNGVLDYSQHGQPLLEGPAFEAMISPPQAIDLGPKEEKNVSFQLRIPAEGFAGTVLGGFYCYEDKPENQEEQSSFSLANKFAYTIGVQLNESDKKLNPKLQLTKIKPGLENGYLTVFATLENQQPLIMSQLEMNAIVTKKGHKETLRELNKTVSLAPRSRFTFPINWENEPLKKGNYELKINLKDTTGKTWQLKKDFTIEGKDEDLNKKAVDVKEASNHSIIYLSLMIVVCLAIIVVLLGYIAKIRKKN